MIQGKENEMFKFSVSIDNTDEDAALEVDVQLEAFGVVIFDDEDDFEINPRDVFGLVGRAVNFVTSVFQGE